VSAEAWVVECAGCKCLIVACGIDPQVEHGQDKSATPPISSAVLTCPCCGGDYLYRADSIMRGRPKRNPLCLRKTSQANGRMDGALLVAASIVASIRLRGQEINRSPKLVAVVNDSVLLARTVMAVIEREF
jgi:hypothetical protein